MRLFKIIATGLGTGYAPVAPGTAGSLLGISVWYILNGLLNGKVVPFYIYFAEFVAVISVVFAGVYSVKKVHSVWKHDASKIVIDEIAGVWIAAFAIPYKWQYYLYAFVLFRFFDITKPLFIKRIDKMKNDWSVMLDDVLAGLYSLLILQTMIKLNIL